MPDRARKLLVIQTAALGYDFLVENWRGQWNDLAFRPMETAFPAVTCTVQAAFRTATPASQHGMVSNGVYLRELRKPLFWEQSSALVQGPRIWERYRASGKRVALLFWQQSLGESADCILSPAPIHRHGGAMIQDCYSQPAGLYRKLCDAVGRKFDLTHYWGPLANGKSSAWIAAATAALLCDPDLAPDLCLTYLPILDYDLQRFGPAHDRSRKALAGLLRQLDGLVAAARANGYEVVIFGDYAIGAVTAGPVLPNLALKTAGLLQARDVKGMQYPDLHASAAFAMVDHEIAHVYVQEPGSLRRVREVLAGLRGVAEVLDDRGQASRGIRHSRCGELLAVAADGYWFAYPWWQRKSEAPDYAAHVDIHNKPGYAPCELFFGWPPPSPSQTLARIKGSHGRCGAGRRACWAATCRFEREPATLIELAAEIRKWLEYGL